MTLTHEQPTQFDPRQRRTIAVLAMFLVVASILALVVRNVRNDAEQQRHAHDTYSALGVTYLEKAYTLLRYGHAKQALPYLVARADNEMETR